MVKINDATQAEAAAQKLLEGRMDYVRRAIDARRALEDAQEAAKDAERADAAAYQAAVKTGGWTEDELRKVGLDRPAKIKRTQQKKRSRTTTQTKSMQGEQQMKPERDEDAHQPDAAPANTTPSDPETM